MLLHLQAQPKATRRIDHNVDLSTNTCNAHGNCKDQLPGIQCRTRCRPTMGPEVCTPRGGCLPKRMRAGNNVEFARSCLEMLPQLLKDFVIRGICKVVQHLFCRMNVQFVSKSILLCIHKNNWNAPVLTYWNPKPLIQYMSIWQGASLSLRKVCIWNKRQCVFFQIPNVQWIFTTLWPRDAIQLPARV